jgi:hypothetical protein
LEKKNASKVYFFFEAFFAVVFFAAALAIIHDNGLLEYPAVM